MAPVKNPVKRTVLNPLEQVGEFVQDTAKKTGEELVNIVNPFPDMWGSPTPNPETQPGGPNFTKLRFDELNQKYAQQDSGDADAIRRQLMQLQGGDEAQQPQLSEEQLDQKRHNEFVREMNERHEQKKQEEAEKERQEAYEEEQKRIAEEEANQPAVDSNPKGKVRKSILGGGSRKANMELPPEVRSERRGGAGKH